jgi:hypothetical protein
MPSPDTSRRALGVLTMHGMRERYSSKPEIAAPVHVSFEVEGVPQASEGWITRLSLAGVDIETLEAPAMGTRIVFYAAFDPGSTEVLSFKGRVQWVTHGRVGLQFVELGAKETHAILGAMRR